MPEKGTFCSVCGKDNGPAEEQLPLVEEVENTGKVKKMKRVALISGCCAILAVLALVLFFGIQGNLADVVKDVVDVGNWEIFRENDIFKQDSYTVSDSKAQSAANTVVATMGDVKLTNAELQAYYWSEVFDFLNNYGGLLYYIGLDYTQPLDEQACQLREGYTWQQYFLENALKKWHSFQSYTQMAKKVNYQLPEDLQTSLNNLEGDLAAAAVYYEYESAIALLKAQMGAGVTVPAYRNYMEAYYTGYMYFGELYEAAPKLSDAELEAYYEEHKAELDPNNTGKDTTPASVDVRHILIALENVAGKEPEGGYTDGQWLAVQAEAEEILKEWQNNPTEENFAELANIRSHDPGSNTTGGMYEGVTPTTSFVQEFLDWCFAEGRQIGDTGLVKSSYGYHVMYLSAQGEEAWLADAREHHENSISDQIMTDALESHPIEINYGKIVLSFVDLAA